MIPVVMPGLASLPAQVWADALGMDEEWSYSLHSRWTLCCFSRIV